MTTQSITQQNFMTRVAQSVVHEEITSREEANTLGRQIAEWALANWEKVVRRYGQGTTDEFEIMERVARDMVEHRARAMETAMRTLPHR
jgi:hypothetical protein